MAEVESPPDKRNPLDENKTRNGALGKASADNPDNNADVAPEKAADQNSDKSGSKAEEKQSPKRMKPLTKLILGIVGAVALLFAILWGIRYWNFSKTHASTDDAYVKGNMIDVSPVIPGTLNALYVDEGDTIKQGQIVGRLSDSGETATLRQADLTAS